jgi:hypothetical protein
MEIFSHAVISKLHMVLVVTVPLSLSLYIFFFFKRVSWICIKMHVHITYGLVTDKLPHVTVKNACSNFLSYSTGILFLIMFYLILDNVL